MIDGGIKIVESTNDVVDLRGVNENSAKSRSPLAKSVSSLKIDRPDASRNKRNVTSLQKLAKTWLAPPNSDRTKQTTNNRNSTKPIDPRFRRSVSKSPDDSSTVTETCNSRPKVVVAKKVVPKKVNKASNSDNESTSLPTTLSESDRTRHESGGSFTELSNTSTNEAVKQSKGKKKTSVKKFEQGDFEKSSLSQAEQLKNQSEAEVQASKPYHYIDEADNRSLDTSAMQISPYWDDRRIVEKYQDIMRPVRRLHPTVSSVTLPQISAPVKAAICHACRTKSLQTRFTDTYPFDDDYSEFELVGLSSDFVGCNKTNRLVNLRKALSILLKVVITISTVFCAIHSYRNATTYLNYCERLLSLVTRREENRTSFLSYILGNIVFTVNYALTMSVRLVDRFINLLLISPFDGSENDSWWYYLLP